MAGKIAMVLFAAGSCLPVAAASAEIIHATPERESVVAAIAKAQTGDTILVAPGAATWAEGVSVLDDKKITLQGSGADSTVITTAAYAVNLGRSGSRLTGFRFVLLGRGVSVAGHGWRVDHCQFESATGTVAVAPRGSPSDPGPTGLVDHCKFINTRVVVLGDASLKAHGLWSRPVEMGSGKTVYVENCTFQRDGHGNSVDANYGGSYVFRYNTVIDSMSEAHSVQGANRATRYWEIYHNHFRPRYVPYPYPHPLSLPDPTTTLLELDYSNASNQISLRWSAVPGAANYRVQRDWQSTELVTTTSWTGMACSAEHVYMVYALAEHGEVLAAEGALVEVNP